MFGKTNSGKKKLEKPKTQDGHRASLAPKPTGQERQQQQQQQQEQQQQRPLTNEFYATGPGLVVVFSQSGGRQGNDADVREIKRTFAELGEPGSFQVMEFHDFTRETLPSHIESVLKELKSRQFFSLTAFIMAHGGRDGASGAEFIKDRNDKDVYIRRSFVEALHNHKVPEPFRGRPRIMFFQCCRGELRNQLVSAGRRLHHVSSFADGDDCVFSTSSQSSSSEEMEVDGASGGQHLVPTDVDNYVLMASVENAVAYRCRDGGGSHFVQSICETLRREPSIDLDRLRRRVQDMMQDKLSDKDSTTAAAVPEVVKNNMAKSFRYVEIRLVAETWGPDSLMEDE